jgi:2'-5' RNA ligase
MKRLFLAIDLPERIIDDIADTCRAIHGARWMTDEQLHLTLRFYGETPPEREEALFRALSGIRSAPFSLRLKGAGQFPPRGEARILWVGVAPEERLMRLAAQVENASVAAGFERERRNFSPHITVARLNAASPERVAMFLVENSLFATEPFEVQSFHLYASHLNKSGAHYTREATFTYVL